MPFFFKVFALFLPKLPFKKKQIKKFLPEIGEKPYFRVLRF